MRCRSETLQRPPFVIRVVVEFREIECKASEVFAWSERQHRRRELSPGKEQAAPALFEILNTPTLFFSFQAHARKTPDLFFFKKKSPLLFLLTPGPVPPPHGPRPRQRPPARARGADPAPAGPPPPSLCQDHGRDSGRPPIRLPGETVFFSFIFFSLFLFFVRFFSLPNLSRARIRFFFFFFRS